MDKRVVLAVAGSGKTRLLIERLNTDERFLIVTYTNNNYETLRQRVIVKFGFVPENIQLLTYFSFLISFCFKPFLSDRVNSRGINWKLPPPYTLRLARSDPKFYMDDNRFLFHNRIAKLIEVLGVTEAIHRRLEKYYDVMLIDEVQDFGGHDLNFLCSLAGANLEQILVGDFFQHTFDTSKDGPTNSTIYNNYDKYLLKIENAGYQPDKVTLIKSHRCSPTVCKYIVDNIDIHIESHRLEDTEIHYVTEQSEADELFHDDGVVKLFYQNKDKYPCYAENWGKSKGQDHYHDVCVVLNKTSHDFYEASRLIDMATSTKSKFYVACTRTKGALYFVSETLYASYKVK